MIDFSVVIVLCIPSRTLLGTRILWKPQLLELKRFLGQPSTYRITLNGKAIEVSETKLHLDSLATQRYTEKVYARKDDRERIRGFSRCFKILDVWLPDISVRLVSEYGYLSLVTFYEYTPRPVHYIAFLRRLLWFSEPANISKEICRLNRTEAFGSSLAKDSSSFRIGNWTKSWKKRPRWKLRKIEIEAQDANVFASWASLNFHLGLNTVRRADSILHGCTSLFRVKKTILYIFIITLGCNPLNYSKS